MLRFADCFGSLGWASQALLSFGSGVSGEKMLRQQGAFRGCLGPAGHSSCESCNQTSHKTIAWFGVVFQVTISHPGSRWYSKFFF